MVEAELEQVAEAAQVGGVVRDVAVLLQHLVS